VGRKSKNLAFIIIGRRLFLEQIKDRPFTLEERGDISSRLDSLEEDINRVW